jgi:hypothetical protein
MKFRNKSEIEIICEILKSDVKILSSTPGGNSIVYIVENQNSTVVVKKYLGALERRTSSLNREVKAINFLKSNNLRLIPNLLDVSEENSLIVLEHLRGVNPIPNKKAMDAIIYFVQLLKVIYAQDNTFPDAIDSISNSADLLTQIENRIITLEKEKLIYEIIEHARIVLNRLSSLNYDSKVCNATYSVSDLGLHNMIRCKEGFRFFDLEFFGADSPVKLIGDFLLHPKNIFPGHLRLQFHRELTQLFNVSESAIAEYLPLSALKWSLIIARKSVKVDSSVGRDSQRDSLNLAWNYLKKSERGGSQLLRETVYCGT